MARQNHITIRVRYSRNEQTLVYRGVGQYGKINMSTLTQQLPTTPKTGGSGSSEYWSAILGQVAAYLSVH
jgi:hypothetical protein